MISNSTSVTILLISVAIIILTVFHPYPYDNVVTRWALSRQLIDNGSINIDPYIKYTSDRAFSNDHYYCDKAVLTSVAAAIPYGITRTIANLISLEIPPSAYRYIAERLSAGISFILLLFFLMKELNRTKKPTFLPLLALGAGSILLPYSTLLYGHVPAAFFLFMSYYFQNRNKYLQADIFGALAAATEFPVMLPFLILAAYRGKKYWSLSRILQLAGIIVLAFLPQLIHNWVAFGNPLTMGYSLETAEAFEGMSRGLFGFTLPSLKAVYLLMLSPERGLFFYMPWTVLGIAGFFRGKQLISVLKNNPLPLMMITYLILFTAYYMPTGGWAFGPRHLIPIIPFFAIGLAKFVSISRKYLFMAALLVLPSILIALIGTFGEIHQPVHPVENPLPIPQWNIGLTMMLNGHHSLWLLGSVGAACIIIALLALWGLSIKKSKLSWKGIAILFLWCLLIIPSALQNWGGKTDYYRAVLAEHRQQWKLASEYYEAAAEDPSAPEIVLDKYEFCRLMHLNDSRSRLEF
ncbi:MAG: hypothetical protein GQ565_03415 [Candidatus Aegiribacteria sp.]|nr:hypothetical protein [Candidatus Aegiribacteria sp.]